MKYLDLVEKLQKENKGYIIIIKNGIFFIGVGKDAIILNKELDLKVTCMKSGMCKVGFQTKSIEKYITKLEEANKSFIIYTYNKEQNKEEEIYRYEGEQVIEERICKDCKNCTNREETEQEIIERVKKLGTTNK
ncbi:MAG: hypothetical protein HFJ48_08110 [Clostridia bacterium]|nr:hypothetical protein [Clostridia bacterium]